MALQLVCEGACNPGIAQLDADVRAERHAVLIKDKWHAVIEGALTNDRLLSRVVRLRHTPHARVSPVVCRCEWCGTTRKY